MGETVSKAIAYASSEARMIEIRRILCPIDFSDASRHALEHSVVIAGWYGSRITALHVGHVPSWQRRRAAARIALPPVRSVRGR